LIETLLPNCRSADGRRRSPQDDRAVLNGILWILGSGARWKELPELSRILRGETESLHAFRTHMRRATEHIQAATDLARLNGLQRS